MTLDVEDIENIESDLRSFALTGTPITHSPPRSGIYEFRWREAGRERQVSLRKVESGIEADIGGEWISYSRFLQSSDMADLGFLAQRTLDLLPTIERTPIALEVEDGSTSDDSVTELDRLLASGPPDLKTRVVFLRGEAGGGKSVTLRELARKRARDFIQGTSTFVCLYVDAQGKALLSLHEALASVLQDLNVTRIRKDTVATLCRNGLVVPIVDGFDELLGAGGLGDAFNSLNVFLADLRSTGQIVAAGRSTFYDQQKMQITASRFSTALDYETTTARILPWTRSDIVAYCKTEWEHDGRRATYLRLLERLLDREENAQLLSKPFYAHELTRGISDGDIDPATPLFPQLVVTFVKREAGKWKDTQLRPILTIEEHLKLLSEIAAEMWLLGGRELDPESVRTIADVFTSSLPFESRRIAVEKSVNYGLFDAAGGQTPHLRFQHPNYFSYFLALQFDDSLARTGTSEAMLDYLDKGVLPESLVWFFAERHRGDSAEARVATVAKICASVRQGNRYYVARQNAGLLVAALTNERPEALSNLIVENLIFTKTSIRNAVWRAPKLAHCEFESVSLLGTRWLQASTTACRFDRLEISRDARMEASLTPGEDVVSLSWPNDVVQYNPDTVGEMLRAIGATVPAAPAAPEVRLSRTFIGRRQILEKFLSKMERNFHVSPDLEQSWGFDTNRHWHEVKTLMERSGLLETRRIQRRGPEGTLQALTKTPDEIRRGESLGARAHPAIQQLWESLRSE